MITITSVDGGAEVLAALAGLEAKVAGKVVRQAMRQALKPVAAAVRNNVPVGETGELRDSIKVRAGKRSRTEISMAVVIDAKDKAGNYMYGSAQEYGTHKMPGKHFMRQAFDATAEHARDQAEKDIRDGIERVAGS